MVGFPPMELCRESRASLPALALGADRLDTWLWNVPARLGSPGEVSSWRATLVRRRGLRTKATTKVGRSAKPLLTFSPGNVHRIPWAYRDRSVQRQLPLCNASPFRTDHDYSWLRCGLSLYILLRASALRRVLVATPQLSPDLFPRL